MKHYRLNLEKLDASSPLTRLAYRQWYKKHELELTDAVYDRGIPNEQLLHGKFANGRDIIADMALYDLIILQTPLKDYL